MTPSFFHSIVDPDGTRMRPLSPMMESSLDSFSHDGEHEITGEYFRDHLTFPYRGDPLIQNLSYYLQLCWPLVTPIPDSYERVTLCDDEIPLFDMEPGERTMRCISEDGSSAVELMDCTRAIVPLFDLSEDKTFELSVIKSQSVEEIQQGFAEMVILLLSRELSRVEAIESPEGEIKRRLLVMRTPLLTWVDYPPGKMRFTLYKQIGLGVTLKK